TTKQSNVETHGHASVRLVVYDILGREVTTLVNQKQKPGTYEVIFDASKYSSGVYYYQLKVGQFIKTKKMMLLK
ncbi:MAG: T9SS type A sorting domain-containing protein, partial [Ignavibacteriae bacterium]|nr:T9SS type A sorting domain-containing protein [Ignavibacteriota bacterium]